jgi:hypothetical protein
VFLINLFVRSLDARAAKEVSIRDAAGDRIPPARFLSYT